jgi:hypothetical protein
MAEELLATETDEKLIASLKEMVFDASLDGTEAQKNAQLAPAAPVPALDREIAEAHGHRVGLEPVRPTETPTGSKENTDSPDESPLKGPGEPTAESTTAPTAAPVYRAVSQDEMMGYDDDFEDEDADDDADYF